jgi:uncharacterized protein YkwD
MTTLPRRPVFTLSLAASATAIAALVLAAPASAAPTAPEATPLLDPAEQHVLERTNALRASVGCGPLTADPAVTAAADQHTAEMASTGTMSHSGADGSSPRTRLAAQGVSPLITAENVAFGYDADGVVDAWMASPGHRRNLLDCRLQFVGIAEQEGATGPYWTQVFAG